MNGGCNDQEDGSLCLSVDIDVASFELKCALRSVAPVTDTNLAICITGIGEHICKCEEWAGQSGWLPI